MLKQLLYYLSIVGPIRDWLRKEALAAAEEVLMYNREELVEELVYEAEARPPLFEVRKSFVPHQQDPVTVIDEIFEEPTEFSCYMDLRSLAAPDAARIAYFMGIRGNGDHELVEIATRTLAAPDDTMEAVIIGPQVVKGRLKVTYRMVAGDSDHAAVGVMAFGIPLYTKKVDTNQ